MVAIEAVKAWIYLFSGHHEAALQICDVVMSMLDSEMSNLIFAIPSIVMVASIYLFLRQHDKFSQVKLIFFPDEIHALLQSDWSEKVVL